jgi:hypothetical protein
MEEYKKKTTGQIKIAEEFYQLVRDLLEKLEMSKTERIHLFQSYRVVMWTYEPQTWAYTKQDINRLMVVEWDF